MLFIVSMEAKELAYSSLLGFGSQTIRIHVFSKTVLWFWMLNVSLQLYLRKLTMYCETGKRKKSLSFSNLVLYGKCYASAGFSLDLLDMGEDLFPPYGGEGQSVNGGNSWRGHRHYGGDLTLIDYIINWKYCYYYCCYTCFSILLATF